MHKKQSIPRSKSTAWSTQVTTEIFAVLKSNAQSAQTTKVFLVLKAMREVHKQQVLFDSYELTHHHLGSVLSKWWKISKSPWWHSWIDSTVLRLVSILFYGFRNEYSWSTNRTTREYIRRFVSSCGIGQPLARHVEFCASSRAGSKQITSQSEFAVFLFLQRKQNIKMTLKWQLELNRTNQELRSWANGALQNNSDFGQG